MNQSEFRDMLSEMPFLPHSIPGQPYDVEGSEVVKWIIAQPGVKQWLFHKATSTGRIAYNSELGEWHGVFRKKPGRPRKEDSAASESPEPATGQGAALPLNVVADATAPLVLD